MSINNNNINSNNIIENALKLYLLGKKTNDKEKSLILFNKSLEYINMIKNNNINIDSEKLSILQTTEADCLKYVNNKFNIFKLIDENNLDEIRELKNVNFREINHNGNTVLHHCIDMGDTSIMKELLKKGGCIDQVNGNGNTLLEYACLKRDPNMISFLIKHGADMKKHLFLRKNNEDMYLNKSDIDTAILLKIIINKCNNNDLSLFDFLGEYFSWNELVGLNKNTVRDLAIGLTSMFKNKNSYIEYKNILIEELNEYRNVNLKKGLSKIDLILLNLVPFINYPFNISNQIILKNELKYLIKNCYKNNSDYKYILLNKLYEIYIQPELFQDDYIGILIYQLINKLNKKFNI